MWGLRIYLCCYNSKLKCEKNKAMNDCICTAWIFFFLIRLILFFAKLDSWYVVDPSA